MEEKHIEVLGKKLQEILTQQLDCLNKNIDEQMEWLKEMEFNISNEIKTVQNIPKIHKYSGLPQTPSSLVVPSTPRDTFLFSNYVEQPLTSTKLRENLRGILGRYNDITPIASKSRALKSTRKLKSERRVKKKSFSSRKKKMDNLLDQSAKKRKSEEDIDQQPSNQKENTPPKKQKVIELETDRKPQNPKRNSHIESEKESAIEEEKNLSSEEEKKVGNEEAEEETKKILQFWKKLESSRYNIISSKIKSTELKKLIEKREKDSSSSPKWKFMNKVKRFRMNPLELILDSSSASFRKSDPKIESNSSRKSIEIEKDEETDVTTREDSNERSKGGSTNNSEEESKVNQSIHLQKEEESESEKEIEEGELEEDEEESNLINQSKSNKKRSLIEENIENEQVEEEKSIQNESQSEIEVEEEKEEVHQEDSEVEEEENPKKKCSPKIPSKKENPPKYEKIEKSTRYDDPPEEDSESPPDYETAISPLNSKNESRKSSLKSISISETPKPEKTLEIKVVSKGVEAMNVSYEFSEEQIESQKTTFSQQAKQTFEDIFSPIEQKKSFSDNINSSKDEEENEKKSPYKATKKSYSKRNDKENTLLKEVSLSGNACSDISLIDLSSSVESKKNSSKGNKQSFKKKPSFETSDSMKLFDLTNEPKYMEKIKCIDGSPINKSTTESHLLEDEKDIKPEHNFISPKKKNITLSESQFLKTPSFNYSPIVTSPYTTIYVSNDQKNKEKSFELPNGNPVKYLTDIFQPLSPTQNLYEQAKSIVLSPLESVVNIDFIANHTEKLLSKISSEREKSQNLNGSDNNSKTSHNQPEKKKSLKKRSVEQQKEEFKTPTNIKKQKRSLVEESEDEDDSFQKKLLKSQQKRKENDIARSILAEKQNNNKKRSSTSKSTPKKQVSKKKSSDKENVAIQTNPESKTTKKIVPDLVQQQEKKDLVAPPSKLAQPQQDLKERIDRIQKKILDINKPPQLVTSTVSDQAKKKYSEERKLRMEKIKEKKIALQEKMNNNGLGKNKTGFVEPKPVSKPIPKPNLENVPNNENDNFNYSISPYKSSDDEDEEDNSKKVPNWAKTPNIRRQLYNMNPSSAERIFGPSQKTCDLNLIFNSKKKYNRRNSFRWNEK